MKPSVLIAVAAAVALAACSKSDAPQAAAQTPAAPAASAAMPVAAMNSGKLLTLERAGIYTYAEVEVAPGRTVWIAGGDLNAQPGDIVEWGDAAVMRNFNAKSLNRSFPEILFVSVWGKAGAAPAQMAPHGTPGGGAPAMYPANPTNPAMAGHPPMGNLPPMGGMPAAGGGTSGVVKSVMNAGGYSYLEVDQAGKTVWVAAPETPGIQAGAKVSWAPGPVMSNFTAKSINKTFDSIVFAGGVSVQ